MFLYSHLKLSWSVSNYPGSIRKLEVYRDFNRPLTGDQIKAGDLQYGSNQKGALVYAVSAVTVSFFQILSQYHYILFLHPNWSFHPILWLKYKTEYRKKLDHKWVTISSHIGRRTLATVLRKNTYPTPYGDYRTYL